MNQSLVNEYMLSNSRGPQADLNISYLGANISVSYPGENPFSVNKGSQPS